MKRTILAVFALCLLVTIGYAEPPTRNHKLNREVSPGKVSHPGTTISSKKVTDISDITLSDLTFRKNKAHLLRKTRRPVHVIETSKKDSYDYKARNHKFKYYKNKDNHF